MLLLLQIKELPSWWGSRWQLGMRRVVPCKKIERSNHLHSCTFASDYYRTCTRGCHSCMCSAPVPWCWLERTSRPSSGPSWRSCGLHLHSSVEIFLLIKFRSLHLGNKTGESEKQLFVLANGLDDIRLPGCVQCAHPCFFHLAARVHQQQRRRAGNFVLRELARYHPSGMNRLLI